MARRTSSRSAQLSRELIVTTALRLVDAGGWDALTMRGLAEALGVYPTAVHWYVGPKANLANLIAERAFDELSLPDENQLTWDSWVAEAIRQWRTVMHRHPNVAVMSAGRLLTSTAALPFIERFVAVLERAGFKGQQLADAYNAVLGFAFGWVAIELSREPGDADGNWSSHFEQALTRLNSLAYPALTRNMPDLMNRTFLLRWESGKERPLDDGFELALTSLLDGLRRAMPSGGGND